MKFRAFAITAAMLALAIAAVPGPLHSRVPFT